MIYQYKLNFVIHVFAVCFVSAVSGMYLTGRVVCITVHEYAAGRTLKHNYFLVASLMLVGCSAALYAFTFPPTYCVA